MRTFRLIHVGTSIQFIAFPRGRLFLPGAGLIISDMVTFGQLKPWGFPPAGVLIGGKSMGAVI